MIFESDLLLIKKLSLPKVELSKVPQLYRASREFVTEQRDDLLDAIIASIPVHPEFKYWSVDTRTHMLMTGMYPCIPGWHCDDFYRNDIKLYGQPDLESVLEKAPAIHYLVVVGDNSRTEFLRENIELMGPEEVQKSFGADKALYYHYDIAIEMQKARAKIVESNTLYSFGPLAFHRGQAATFNGWRMFFRATLSNHRTPKNELRYQTQVYTQERVSW